MFITIKSLSASYVAERFGVTEKTARLFMHKVRETMISSGNYPMDGYVHVDEFLIGGKEVGKVGRSYNAKNKKVVCAVHLTDEGKVIRVYSMKIENYSSNKLNNIFTDHISQEAKVTTDCWKGYRLLIKDYNITQIESNGGLNFKAFHTIAFYISKFGSNKS